MTLHHDPFGIDDGFMENMRPLFQFLYEIYFRVEALGTEYLPKKGPAIFVANHSGTLPYDGAMLHLAIYNNHPRGMRARFLVDEFAFGLPVIGPFIRRMGGVPAKFENALRLLEGGEAVVVFPEGVAGIAKTYDQRYRLEKFGRGGFVKLSKMTGAPVIPTAIIGAEEIHPLIWKSKRFGQPFGLPFVPFTPLFPWLGPLGLVPLPSKWKIVFGRPIGYSGMKAGTKAAFRLGAEKMKARVQAMLDKALAGRGSVWV